MRRWHVLRYPESDDPERDMPQAVLFERRLRYIEEVRGGRSGLWKLRLLQIGRKRRRFVAAASLGAGVVLGLSLLAGCRNTRNAVALQGLLDTAVRRSKGPGGGIVRIESQSGGVLWEGASGSDASGGRIGVADTFEVASVTKTFTAACVLMLAEEGRLRLDEPIGGLLPRGAIRGLLVVRGHDFSPEITVRQLLNHTSGLPDYWNDPPTADDGDNTFVRDFLADPNRFWEPEETLAYVRRLWPIAVPGERYHYSDTGYVLLGLIVEHATGRKLHEVFRERLFAPLGMQDTFFSYREAPPSGAHESHRYEGPVDLTGQRRQSAEWASGGLVSSAKDLARFLFALAQGKLFKSQATWNEMTTWRPTGTADVDYGLGLFHVRLDDDEGQLWGHDGHGNAFMYYWPEKQIALVGTLNQTENDWWDLAAPAVRVLCDCRAKLAPRDGG